MAKPKFQPLILENIPHSRPWINKDDISSINLTLNSLQISRGNMVSSFENYISRYLRVKNSFAFSSGTSALIFALELLDFADGGEVILPNYVCKSVLEAVIYCGGVPIICDVNSYGLIDYDIVLPHLTNKTKAIIAVHIFGFFCDIEKLKPLGIPIIEDACQAFGLEYKGKLAGSLGDIGILSFNATKCLTTGEGGMLVTNNTKYAEKVYELRNSLLKGNFSPMSDIQASLGLNQLKRYSKFILKRKLLRIEYEKLAREINLNIFGPANQNFYFRFAVLINGDFEKVKDKFFDDKVIVRKGVDNLLHKILGFDDTKFAQSLQIFKNLISLPFYPSLSKKEFRIIKKSCQKIFPKC